MSKLEGRKVKVTAPKGGARGYKGDTGIITGVDNPAFIYPVTVAFEGGDLLAFDPEELRYLNNRQVRV